MMPALVRTAGLATRLRPLSAVRATAALPVAGRPLVRRILERLIADLGEQAIAETMPRQEGNQMHVILSAKAGRKSAPKARPETQAAEQAEEE